MKLTRYILSIILIISGLIAYAQPNVSPKETINGKEYYMHTVERGTTLYGLSRMYQVTIDDINLANPGLDAVLDVGQIVKIPVKTGDNANNNTNSGEQLQDDPEYVTHKVLAGETVSFIARKYMVSIADIYNLNPGSDQSIREGQVLKIKKKSVNTTQVNATTSEEKVDYLHVISGGETMYALSKRFHISIDSIKLLNNDLPQGLKTGDTLKLKISKSMAIKFQNAVDASQNNIVPDTTKANNNLPSVLNLFHEGKKDIYEVGLLLPFFLDKNQLKLEKVSSTSDELTYLFEPTRQSLDFYNGFVLAVDSLRKAGLKVNLHVYDTWNDTSRINSILKTEEFSKMDLIVGPTDNVESVARYAKANTIPLVCPFSYTNKILFNNQYVSKVTTSLSVIINEMSNYVAANYYESNIFILDGKDKKDDAASETYFNMLTKKLTADNHSTDLLKKIKMEGASIKHLTSSFSKTKTNVLIVPSNDIVYISSLLNNLNNLTNAWNGKDYTFTVIGTDDWIKLDDIDINYKLKFNVHVPSPVIVNFDDSTTVNGFIKPFRKKYSIDPDRFAMTGFDIGYFYLAGYLTEGKNFINRLEYYDVTMISNRFKLKQIAEGSGYLNSNVFILEYEDFQLIKRN